MTSFKEWLVVESRDGVTYLQSWCLPDMMMFRVVSCSIKSFWRIGDLLFVVRD
jgi:hypothetical protein